MTDRGELGAPSLPPAMPEVAGRVFAADRLPLVERYAAWLADAGVVRGLIGPREVPRLWDRHILNCAVLATALPETGTVADIGSGAGLPGLVVAITNPSLQVTLIEPLLRRTTFLSEVVEDLGLSNVEVVRGRADALHGQRRFDAVTSRAVAPLGRLLEWSMPLVAPSGALVAMKGSSVGDEIEEAAPTLRRLGCARPEVSELGAGLLDSTTVCLRVAWADPAKVSLASARRPAGSAKKMRKQRDRRREA
ncbi:16S rRNA (guanine(527)-N(7))-methyltransferase RsmG [Nocardioides panacihumi]|uniref:Ribosomal RNA small subunit methyltransferase G n=2 Tax=Nocardioides panacihumi TaxID=400774 RepID=A0ABN2QJS0_9ACTN